MLWNCVEKQWCKYDVEKVFQLHTPLVVTGAGVVAESSQEQKAEK